MASKAESGNAKYIVLCLGLLIGFVVGFVLLLSSLPVNNNLADYDPYATEPVATQQNEFDFYNFLDGQPSPAAPKPVPVPVVPPPDQDQPLPGQHSIGQYTASVPAPTTTVVPANAQIANPAFTEVPANYSAQQSYFLQAGRFIEHNEAQTMRAQVLMLGLDAFIVTRVEADGSTAHRVRVGPYFDQNILTEAKKRLRRGGINYEIIRVTG